MRSILALIVIGFACDSAPIDPGPDAGNDAGVDAGTDGGTDAGSDPIELCPGGALRHFSMTPLSSLPSLSAIDLPTPPQGAEVVSAGSGLSQSVRFDVCERDGELSLRGLLYRVTYGTVFYRWDDTISSPQDGYATLPGGMVYELRLPPGAFIVEGLSDALQGNLQSLQVRFAHDNGLLLQGHDGFIALAQGRVGESTFEYNSLEIVVGGLAESDVFADLKCKLEEWPLAKTFSLGSATFDMEACGFQDAGHTTGYRIVYLAVQDSSTDLTEAERARFEFDGEGQLQAVLTYAWNHHNACDSFHLALDHADYAASAAPIAGCGATVPEAPPRTFDETDNTVHYRLRHHAGTWVEGTLPGCHHYLFCQ
jgi:hypothetical protein